jgi:hypothetical protein
MKQLSTFILLCSASALLLTSCGSRISVTKRHYNDGHYVTYTHEQKNIEQIPLRIHEREKPKPSQEQAISTSRFDARPGADSVTLNASNDTRVHTPVLKYHSVHPIAPVSMGAHARHLFNEAKKIKSYTAEDAGFSLFWIVILVLLILWALGLLAGGFGLGGFINILLVIALILLILWLLRVL